jgi:hypothetical protein
VLAWTFLPEPLCEFGGFGVDFAEKFSQILRVVWLGVQFQEHAECADVACECLVVERFGFFALCFFCYFGELVDDFPFCFYEVFGVAALLRFFVYTPSIYRLKFWSVLVSTLRLKYNEYLF